jgi:hypothetical protein
MRGKAAEATHIWAGITDMQGDGVEIRLPYNGLELICGRFFCNADSAFLGSPD